MKKSVIIAFALIAVLVLTGCGAKSAETTEPVETTEPMEAIVPVETTEPMETEPVETTTPAAPYANDPNASVEYFFPLSNSMEVKVEVKVGDNTHVLSADKDIALLYTTFTRTDSIPKEFLKCSFEYYPKVYTSYSTMDFNVHSEHKVSRLELYIMDATKETPVEQYWTTDIMVARVNYATPASTVSVPWVVYDTSTKNYHIVTAAHIVFENGDIIYALNNNCGI